VPIAVRTPLSTTTSRSFPIAVLLGKARWYSLPPFWFIRGRVAKMAPAGFVVVLYNRRQVV
jgi:hypothetical protein